MWEGRCEGMKRAARFFRRIIRLIFSRVGFIALLVLLQALVLAFMFSWFRASFAWYYAASLVVSALSVLHVLSDRSNPAYKIAWVIPILLFPLFGGPFYFMFRRNRLSRRERKQGRSNELRFRDMMRGRRGEMDAIRDEDPEAALQARYLLEAACAPVWKNAGSRYYPAGEAVYPRMLSDLKRAQKFIFLEYFIIQEGEMWNSILDVLEEKAKSGVEVRLLYDDVGSLFTLPARYDRRLNRRGIQARAFSRFANVSNSRFNNRDHRKICVVDGVVGYTGGFNLADEYINHRERFGYWKDTAVRLEGEAVTSLTALFLSMWDYAQDTKTDLSGYLAQHAPASDPEDGWVQPYGDSPLDDENVGENAYLNLIAHARKFIWFTTPYLILDNELRAALCLAARSGVDVRIVTPRVPDKKIVFAATRSNYPELLEAGVKIYEFLPGFIHAKMAVSDDKYAIVGTINLDFRSLFLHYECAALFLGGRVVGDVKKDIAATIAKCEQITPELAARVVPRRPLPAILKLFSPMM